MKTEIPKKGNKIKDQNSAIVCDSIYVDMLHHDDLEVLKNSGKIVVDYGWVLDSISKYKILPTKDYVVEIA